MRWPCFSQAASEMGLRLVTDPQDSAGEAVGALGQQCHRRIKPWGLLTQRDERDSGGKPCGKNTYMYRQQEEEGRSGQKDGVAQPTQATGELGSASPRNQQGRPLADPDVGKLEA